MAASMAQFKLTEGAVMMICKRESTAETFQPVVQVIDLKLVNTAQQSGSERYRLLLSDGTHYQQGMLGTQLNGLVKSGKLQKGSIVQLKQYVCNPVQERLIIIVIELDVVVEMCEFIGEPVPATRSVTGAFSGNPQSSVATSPSSGIAGKMNVSSASSELPKVNQSHASHVGAYSNTPESGRYTASIAPPLYPNKTDPGTRFNGSSSLSGSYGDQKMAYHNNGSDNPRPPLNAYACPQPTYQQPPSMYSNRGPVAKNEAPPRIMPITALNPYQGRWTIKARVTSKGELRHYNNPRGDGKVFSFDLLDAHRGEIRVTCFNMVADQFYNQIEPGKVYFISKGSLKPAQKNFNHLKNDFEIFLESTSTIQPCFEDDQSIPQQQFHFHQISEIEGMDNNSVVDLIGVVTSINPSTSIMRKNGIETQKRTLQLKDMSGRSVELTLWGNFCQAEGQRLQNMCDSGMFPVLAVKSGRVSDFNGKAVGTISSSQLSVEPDFPEARTLREWFEKEGRSTPSVSISREVSSIGRTDVRKTISQIKDERLGTSEKPDWITVSATVSFIKVDNFCYTACPIMIGDRQCSKKVTNNGDGKWRCDRCDQSVDECDYRYILQLQIQDHTGLTWVTAFQEGGEEIMGVPAKRLYYLKYEEQDDEKFAEIIRKVLFTKFIMKLKIKEETFSDEQRVRSTVVKAESINFSTESRFLLDLMEKLRAENASSVTPKTESTIHDLGLRGAGNVGGGQFVSPSRNISNVSSREYGTPNLGVQYENQYSSSRPSPSMVHNSHTYCNSCGGSGHSSMNCPSITSAPTHPIGGGMYSNRSSGPSGGGVSGECFKCHQTGHWARDCPGLAAVPPAYGNSGFTAR
ncbi:replication protein A 70 kDa DNA-binding subunit A [Cucurbita moschata]|uniref:Replication protein A subunit n=2 Tax=Cucurbita TaxID=3660 RepID=A0A6J1FW46_CUCMO